MKNFQKISLSQILEPSQAARANISEEGIDELANSMKKLGQLQPIGVREKNGRYEIEYGHRRYLAAIRLNWPDIDAIVLEPKDEEELHLERAHENLIRENLNPLDEAKLVYKLVYEDGRGVEATAKLLSKTESWVLQRCDVLRWPKDVQTAIELEQISLSVGKQIAKVRDDERRASILDAAIKHGATKRVVQQWVSDMTIDTFQRSQEADSEMGTNIVSDMSEVKMECRVCGKYESVYTCRHIWLCPNCLMGVRELAREVRAEIAKRESEEG